MSERPAEFEGLSPRVYGPAGAVAGPDRRTNGSAAHKGSQLELAAEQERRSHGLSASITTPILRTRLGH